MEAILVTPKDERQEEAIKSFFEAVGLSFRAVAAEDVPEDGVFYPNLERQLAADREDLEKGRTTRLDMRSFEDFYNSIGSYGG